MGYTMKIIFRIITLLMICFGSLTIMAQQYPLAGQAAKLCQQKKYDEAVAKIEEALQSETESASPYTWYVKAFIHKEIYKEYESTDRHSKNRETAVAAFIRTNELDKKGEHTSMTKIGLKYLASTYYNDALMRTREFVLADENDPQTYFNSFRKLMRIVDVTTNMTPYEVEFQKNMAQRYFNLWQTDVDNHTYADKAAGCYREAIRLDSTNCDLYYNLGVVYYNKAVFKYRKIGPETDIFEVITVQMEGVELFKTKALPVMTRARLLCPDRGDIIKGLMYINRALERESDVEYFKSEIERLIEEGKLKDGPPKQ